jgi:ribosome-associated protein
LPEKLKKRINKNENALLKILIDAVQEKRGKDLIVVDLRGLEQAVCDYFIICHGDSTTQVNAIADAVEEFAKKKANTRPHCIEGMQNAQWVLLDFFDIVVHVFQKDFRAFYQLEDLWSDGKIEMIKEK